MRNAELLNILFFSSLALLAWLVPVPLRRRVGATVIGAAGISVCFLMTLSPSLMSEKASHGLRDWLPTILILVAYHQAGQLFTKPWRKFQGFLIGLDRMLLGRFADRPGEVRLSGLLTGYLECCYVACYPLVPAALGVLHLMQLGDRTDEFWTVVLPSTYLCYALVPLLPTLPPRLLKAEQKVPLRSGRIRAFNGWILHHASIRANTFPSAHVAACVAASLVLLRYDWLWGVCFLWVSVSIAGAVVMRRYHYLADAVLGTLIPIAPILLSR
jgi:hypothetical protein